MIANKLIVLRLIYLWAFVESGLGGLMHLLHIPLTGFIIGGFSIITNCLLAKYTERSIKTMLTCMGFVLTAKFALSPQSPLGAYIAVAFQGLLAIIIFRFLTINIFSVLLYATLVMLENAIQKPLMAYIIFGDELVRGTILLVNKFFNHPHQTFYFLNGLILLYFSIYLGWGIIIGLWCRKILTTLSHYQLPNDIRNIENIKAIKIPPTYKWLTIAIATGVILISLYLYFAYYQAGDLLNYLIKISLWIVALIWVIPTILKNILRRYSLKYAEKIDMVRTAIPQIKMNIYRSYYLSKKEKGLNRIQSFIFHSIYLNVFYDK